MRLELFKGSGLQPWYLRLIAANNRVLSVSEGYFSKSNAKRAARKNFPGIPLKDSTVPRERHLGASQLGDE